MPAVLEQVGYDFSNIELSIDLVYRRGTQLVLLQPLPVAEGIEDISYTGSLEREKMYGTSRNPLDRTEGIADYEASLTMLMYWWRYIVDVCLEEGIGLGQVELNILVMYVKGGIPLQADFLYRCGIKSPENAFKRGAENLMVPVSLDPMDIFYNGVNMFGKRSDQMGIPGRVLTPTI